MQENTDQITNVTKWTPGLSCFPQNVIMITENSEALGT